MAQYGKLNKKTDSIATKIYDIQECLEFTIALAENNTRKIVNLETENASVKIELSNLKR